MSYLGSLFQKGWFRGKLKLNDMETIIKGKYTYPDGAYDHWVFVGDWGGGKYGPQHGALLRDPNTKDPYWLEGGKSRRNRKSNKRNKSKKRRSNKTIRRRRRR